MLEKLGSMLPCRDPEVPWWESTEGSFFGHLSRTHIDDSLSHRWPGQVMGMCQVSAKMLADRQPHTKPVSTMGDSQYCWAMPCDILRFQESRPSIKVPKRLALVHPKPAMEHTQRTLNLRVRNAKSQK